MDADTLTKIPWVQNIRTKAVETIFKATVDGPDALMEVYACNERAVSSLILLSSLACMTVMDFVRPREQIQPLTR